MAIKFDPKLGRDAAESITSALNGSFPECMMKLHQFASVIGDNPLADTLKKNVVKVVDYFNDNCAPAANVVHQNMLAREELAVTFANLDGGTVADGGDIGHVEAVNYDAAKAL